MTSKMVLVVDPHPATHRKVEDAFHGSGLSTLHARSAAEVDAQLDGQQVDLILLAISVPGESGYELARRLRDRFPAALIYLFAGGFEVYNAQRADESGVDGRIPIPFTPASLRAVVEDAVGPIGGAARAPAPGWTAASGMGASGAVAPAEPEVPTYTGVLEISDVTPLGAESVAPVGSPVRPPPVSEERLATFLPRDYREAEPVVVDPNVVMPVMEQAILEVLPEVVESVLRSALLSSPSFRRMVADAVEDAVAAHLPSIIERLAEEQRVGK